jgi:hypothetical protein
MQVLRRSRGLLPRIVQSRRNSRGRGSKHHIERGIDQTHAFLKQDRAVIRSGTADTHDIRLHAGEIAQDLELIATLDDL